MESSSLISLAFFSFLSFYFFAVNAQQSDSCNSNLSISQLIPFKASNLQCFNAWKSQDFILRYANSGTGVWSYVVSTPDTGSYVAVGFSENGKMVGSSAVVGWITASGPGIVKQYFLLGETSDKCPPDIGSLKIVNGTQVIVSKSSRLYLAFQIAVDQPRPYLIYAVGPKNQQPSSMDYLLWEHRDMTSTSVDYGPVSAGMPKPDPTKTTMAKGNQQFLDAAPESLLKGYPANALRIFAGLCLTAFALVQFLNSLAPLLLALLEAGSHFANLAFCVICFIFIIVVVSSIVLILSLL